MTSQPHPSESYRPGGRSYQPDELDQRILNELQTAFPLVRRPFAVIADRLDAAAPELLERVTRLKEAGIIRQISAIFDSRRLGYQSSLVAMRFPPDELDAGAAIISLHPGVSHNYKRNHRYNLWFTIATPPSKSLEAEVAALAERARPEQTWLLPTIKLFKIGVNFDATGDADITATEDPATSIGLRSAASWQAEVTPPSLTEEELTAIRVLQVDLPVVDRPFEVLAEQAGMSVDRLLELAATLLKRKQMRRFAAVLRHRKAGFRANAMGVWVVPEERIDAVGYQMATFRAVSHCYRRPTYPDWPYSVFTMIHGRRAEDCVAVAEAMAAATGITEYELLYSTKEYKKTRVRYFVDDDAFDVSSIPPRP